MIMFHDEQSRYDLGSFRQRKTSVVNLSKDKRPDWYLDLTEEQLNTFKALFEMLDSDSGGSLDVEELFELLNGLDIELSIEEVKQVLSDLNKEGHEEIDFDEFLYAIAETKLITEDCQDENRDAVSRKLYTRRQSLCFTAITRFAIRNTLGEIERFYDMKERHAPHVLGCYTAGMRLIGLNDRQLELEMRRMQKGAKNQKSPYAKPILSDRKAIPLLNKEIDKPDHKRLVRPMTYFPHHARPMPIKKKILVPAVARPTKSPTKSNNFKKSYNNYKPGQSQVHNMSPAKTILIGIPDNLSVEVPKTEAEVSYNCMPDQLQNQTNTVSSCEKLGSSQNLEIRRLAITSDDNEASLSVEVLKTEADVYYNCMPDQLQNQSNTVSSCEKLGISHNLEIRRSAITSDDNEVFKRLQELAETGNVIARIPGIHLVPQIRNKLVNGNMQSICSSMRKRRRTLGNFLPLTHHMEEQCDADQNERTPPAESKTAATQCKAKKRGYRRGWTIPRIERSQVPLPVIRLSDGNVEKKFTVEDVTDIRKWVSEAMAEYYATLKKAHVRTAYTHWDDLHTDEIESKRLRELFRKAYRAYSPHEEEEAFVISPWIPGRWYFRHTSNNDSNAFRENRIGSCYSAPPFRQKGHIL